MRSLVRTLAVAAIALTATVANATEDFCVIVQPTSDGFLALRTGPGTEFKTKARLRPGDLLTADTRQCIIGRPDLCDDENRQWTYVTGVPRLDGKKAEHFTTGWVYRKFTKELGPDDPRCTPPTVASATQPYSWHHKQDPSIEKTKLCEGKITANGGTERLVQAENINQSCLFDARSADGKKILRECRIGYPCKVQARVNDDGADADIVIRVLSVRSGE